MAAAYVNDGDGFNSASASSIAAAATSHTTGNLLVCGVRHEGATTTISISDTAGNTWVPLTKVAHPNGDMWLQLFYVLNCTGNASNVVTATFGAARTWRYIQVQQFSGLNTYDEEDSGTTSAGTTVTAGTVNIDGAGVVVNAIANYGGLISWSASTGYTLVKNTGDATRAGMSYELETGSSAESPGASGSANEDWIIVSAAFLEAGAAAPPVITVQPTSQVAADGGTASFTTTVTGATSYQWETLASLGGSWGNVSGGSGATSDDYTTGTLSRASDAGRYYRLKATNVDGDTYSDVVALSVTDIPTSYDYGGFVIGSG